MKPEGRKNLFFLLVLFAALGRAAAQDASLFSRLDPVPPFPELRKAAIAAGIPLDGMTAGTNTNVLCPGDSVTALITLHQKGNRRTQWFVYFQVVASTNRPSAPSRKPVVLYNAMGDKFEFARSPVTFRIRTIGPYVASPSIWGAPVPKDDYGRASVNGTFLSLGLEKSAAAIYRINGEARKLHATNLNFSISTKPATNVRGVENNQKLAVLLGVTSAEKTALATWLPTLMSYFNAVGETPDLEGIMWKVVSLPSLWSIVRHAGIRAWIGVDTDDIHPLAMPSGWNLPRAAHAFTLPIRVTLNREPALDTTLIVTDPRPSLLDCGGIIGFVAQNPANTNNYMTLRVISARCGVFERLK